MSTVRSPPPRPISPANTTYSGISSYRSDYRPAGSGTKTPSVPPVDAKIIARTHHVELTDFLASHLTKENQGSRTNARDKLTKLTSQQFQELSTDVYDELMRRKGNSTRNEVPFLPVREDFHPKRNQARQKLATLPQTRFKDLSSDVYFELGRRWPEFREEIVAPATPGSPTSAYDDSPLPESTQSPPPLPRGASGSGTPEEISFDQPAPPAPRRRGSQRDPDNSYGSSNSGPTPRKSMDSQRERSRPSMDSAYTSSIYAPSSSTSATATRRPSRSEKDRDRELGTSPSTAKSGMIIPNKSTIAEEDPIEVPFGTGSPPSNPVRGDRSAVDDRDEDSDFSRPPLSKSPPPINTTDGGGLSALSARLANMVSPTNDRDRDRAANDRDRDDLSDVPNKSNDEYYTPSIYGRSSVASDRSGPAGAPGHSRSASKMGKSDREVEIMKEDLKREYEFKIATLQKKSSGNEERVKVMEEELILLREKADDHGSNMRAIQRELDDIKAARTRDQMEHKEEVELWRGKCDRIEAENLQNQNEANPELLAELQSEFNSLVVELQELQGRYDELLASKEESDAALEEAERESKDWKRRYEVAKTELRAVKATSTLHTPQLQAPGMEGDLTAQIPYAPDGGVLDTHLTAFQSSIDALLTTARSSTPAKVLIPMKTVVDAVSAILNYPRLQNETEMVAALNERLEDTLSNLVVAARNHAQSYGLSPVSLLDAAASHVSETVLELARCVKIRRGSSDDAVGGGGMATSSSTFSPQTRTPDVSRRQRSGPISRTNSATGARKATGVTNHRAVTSTSDPSSSNGSSSPTIFDTPVASTNPVAQDDGAGPAEVEDSWSELKPYLEAQSEALVYAIQSVLSSVRSPTPAPSLTEHLTQIITIVSSIVAVCNDSVPHEGRALLRELGENCDRLSEVQSSMGAGGGAGKEARQIMAKSSFAVANGMKNLMKL